MPKLPFLKQAQPPVFEDHEGVALQPGARLLHHYPALYPLVGDPALYIERRGQYGDSEQGFGRVMDALFPEGLTIHGHEDWVRYGLFHQMVGKVSRYANNFSTGGHSDSLRDIRVYSAMLQAEDET